MRRQEYHFHSRSDLVHRVHGGNEERVAEQEKSKQQPVGRAATRRYKAS